MEGSQTCFLHPTVVAAAACDGCGNPVCHVCRRSLNALSFCEACAANRHEQSPLAATVFALLVPGLGQVYNAEYRKGLWVFLTGWLVVPWVWGIVDARRVAGEIQAGRRPGAGVWPGYIVLAIKLGVVGLSLTYGFIVWGIVATLGMLARLISGTG